MPQGLALGKTVPIYGGTPADNPCNVIQKKINPPSTPTTAALLGTLWINQTAQTAWVLVGKTPTTQVWDQLGLSTGTVGSLTGNSGGAITPSAGNINIKGTANQINIVGTTSTLTASISTTLVVPGTIATTSGYIGQITGTVTAGNIGEQIITTITSGAAVTMTTSTTVYNIATINLTAGVWDVQANGVITGATQTWNEVSVGTTTTDIGTLGLSQGATTASAASAKPVVVTSPTFRVGLSATTSYYLNAASTFSGSATGYGTIRAVRVA